MKQKADLILKNGAIYTMVCENSVVEALAVHNGKIVYTGTTEEVLAHCEAPQVVDLQGKTVLPGMGDSHLHFFAYCQTHTTVDLGGCTSKAEVISKLAARAAETPKGQWVKGSNFDESKWDADNDHLPTKADLDMVSLDHPVMMKRVCLHTAVANTAALAAAGIGRGYTFGPGGLVELDEDGVPNGILREQATKIFDELIPDPAKIPEVKEKIMREALEEASSQGLTTIHTYAAEIWKYTEDPEDYLCLDRKGQLPLRVVIYLDTFYRKPYLTRREMDDPYHKVCYGGHKVFSDGSLGSRSAKLLAPYSDDPETDGILVQSQQELNDHVLKAYEMGLQPRHPLHRRQRAGLRTDGYRVYAGKEPSARYDRTGAGRSRSLPHHPRPDGHRRYDPPYAEAAGGAGSPAGLSGDGYALGRGAHRL